MKPARHLRAVRRVAAALAGASALAACSPVLDWRESRPEGSGLLVLMPCRPDTFARSVPLAGVIVRMEMASCRAGDVSWAVAHADVGEPARVAAALEALRAAAAANAGAGADAPAIGAPRALAVPGSTPNPAAGRLAYAGRKPDGSPLASEVALFARGTRVFQATALGSALPAEGTEVFFGSLKLDGGSR